MTGQGEIYIPELSFIWGW